MWLRTIALLVSLTLHGLIGLAFLPRLQQEELDVLDFGSGQDIELMPQGMVMDELSSRGDNIATITTPESVPVDARKPSSQPSVSPAPAPLHDVSGETSKKPSEEVAAISQQKPTPLKSAAEPSKVLHDSEDQEQARDVQQAPALTPQQPSEQPPTITSSQPAIDLPVDSGKQVTEDIAPIEDQKPPQQRPTVSTSEQLHDAAEPLETKKVDDSAPVKEQQPAPQRPTAKPTEQMTDLKAAEKSAVERDIPKATDTPVPLPLGEASAGKPGELPPPVELKESQVTQLDVPSPPDPVKEQTPDTKPEEKPDPKAVEAQPQQVAIVTEESSGRAKTGGNPRIVGMYIAKVNQRVQKAKVYPNSRQTGFVILKYTIAPDGTLLSKQIISSSRSPALDEAALAAVERAKPFPPVPPEVSLKPVTFTQTFKFILR